MVLHRVVGRLGRTGQAPGPDAETGTAGRTRHAFHPSTTAL
ncbi:hypothetical protein GZL_08265 [Streptomyces sp. 769]|nr:hypothetical protein GZL_08265 [Streptomyces sp. 769]